MIFSINKKDLVADTPMQVEIVRIMTLKAALKLELVGLKGRPGVPTAYKQLKTALGIKGTRQRVLEQAQRWVDETIRIGEYAWLDVEPEEKR